MKNIIFELCEKYYESKNDKKDSVEALEQNLKCNKIYKELEADLNEEQRKKLLILDDENFKLCGQLKEDGIIEGAEKGFKLAFRLLSESLK